MDDHDQRELLHTLSGLKDMLKDVLYGADGESLQVKLARLEERLSGHARLIAAIGAAIGALAGALVVLAD